MIFSSVADLSPVFFILWPSNIIRPLHTSTSLGLKDQSNMVKGSSPESSLPFICLKYANTELIHNDKVSYGTQLNAMLNMITMAQRNQALAVIFDDKIAQTIFGARWFIQLNLQPRGHPSLL